MDLWEEMALKYSFSQPPWQLKAFLFHNRLSILTAVSIKFSQGFGGLRKFVGSNGTHHASTMVGDIEESRYFFAVGVTRSWNDGVDDLAGPVDVESLKRMRLYVKIDCQ